MSRSSSSASPPPADAELLLPRPPGVIRQFWARHPRLTDVLVALLCFLLSSGPVAASFTAGDRGVELDSGVSVDAPVLTSVSVLVVGACVALLWRRTHPRLVFALAAATQIAFVFLPSGTASPTVAVAIYSLAVYRSSRACWIALGIAVGSAVTVALVSLAGTSITSVNVVLETGVTGLIGALVGVNVGNRKRYLAAVIDRSRQLLVERDQQARLATDAERRRIAREMHDIVSHSLTVIVALTEGAAATDDRDRARAVTVQAAATARSALREMRSMLGVLRDESGEAPLAPLDEDAVPVAVERARQAGFPVSLTVSGRPDVPRAVGFALARIVQEGLTNAMRHAPRATAIDVTISYLPDAVAVEVRNDGAAASANVGGYGLRGLRERVAHVGGTIDSAPAAPGRWRLRAWLPHEPAAAPSGIPPRNDPPEAP